MNSLLTTDITILFEDEDILVINKPAGVVVNDATSVSGTTIQSWFAEKYLAASSDADFSENVAAPRQRRWQTLVPANFNPEYGTPEEIFAARRGLVHRLDKDTSGALVLAKNPGSLVVLLQQFKERTVQKTYTCLVHGRFGLQQDVVRAPVGRSKRDSRRFTVLTEGRSAETEYKVKRQFSGLKTTVIELQPADFKQAADRSYQGFSLVTCYPKTGRTHQIRVHMAHIQHPLVGDSLYVGKKRTKLDAIWCPRQFLHAESLVLQHPASGQDMEFQAPLAPDLLEVLEQLEGVE